MNNPATTARLFLASAAVAASLVWPSLALSQAQPGEDDLRALRYYISQNETDAVSAENRRLQAVFPGWLPPTDLGQILQTGPTTEVDAIYAHIASGDLAGARQILTDTRGKFPKWIPPADMLSQLDLAESQASFDAAIAAGNAQTALRLATATPALLRCDRINNTWQVAELQAQTGNAAGALVAYRQILAACTNVPDIVATIEKANAVASTDDLSSLIATARQRFPASAGTFDALETRMLAGRGIVVPGAKPAKAAAEPQPAVKPATAPAAVAPTATVAGPAVAPRNATSNLSRLPRSGDGRVGQTRAAAKAGNFRECLARSAQPRSLDIVYERAWCAYELERPLEALAGFTAAAGGGLGGTVTRDARFGMALAYLKRNMTDQAAGIAANRAVTIGVSIGIALASEPNTKAQHIMKDADAARYKAKEEGRGIFRFFESGMHTRLQERQELKADLRQALARDEFRLEYQAIVSLKTGKVSGFEALLRWNHPVRGIFHPTDFIPLAEEIGVIADIGEWVINRACTEAATWPDDVSISVNLSPAQMLRADLLASISRKLTESGLSAQRLQLEITETVLIKDTDCILSVLLVSRNLGVRIAMDDFRTGHSTLNYLRQFPFDTIKIDQSFVADVADSPQTAIIVRSVIDLARGLGISTVAEGIETEDQLEALRALGFDAGQGYLFSRPVPASEVLGIILGAEHLSVDQDTRSILGSPGKD